MPYYTRSRRDARTLPAEEVYASGQISRQFPARFAGICRCGCMSRFEANSPIVMLDGRALILGHTDNLRIEAIRHEDGTSRSIAHLPGIDPESDAPGSRPSEETVSEEISRLAASLIGNPDSLFPATVNETVPDPPARRETIREAMRRGHPTVISADIMAERDRETHRRAVTRDIGEQVWRGILATPSATNMPVAPIAPPIALTERQRTLQIIRERIRVDIIEQYRTPIEHIGRTILGSSYTAEYLKYIETISPEARPTVIGLIRYVEAKGIAQITPPNVADLCLGRTIYLCDIDTDYLATLKSRDDATEAGYIEWIQRNRKKQGVLYA